jgi:hypothetical protein
LKCTGERQRKTIVIKHQKYSKKSAEKAVLTIFWYRLVVKMKFSVAALAITIGSAAAFSGSS